MSNDPSAVRRLLPHQNSQPAGSSFSFATPTGTYQQQPRETQKNYVFVDEHNRHKRLKVMRACEGCRRRKIKCDAATTNTWPCGACIRLKLHCVRPNGYDGSSSDTQFYEPSRPQYDTSHVQDDFRQGGVPLHADDQLLTGAAKPPPAMYAPQTTYPDSSALYHTVQYAESTAPQPGLHYTSVPSAMGVVDQSYPPQNVFPTPPMQHGSRPDSPPDAYSPDQYGQQQLADVLGSLRVDEAGTAPYLNSKMSRGQEEEPALEDADDYKSVLPPLVSGPGLKIRIPPELMPDDDTVLHYFDLYFSNVHPYVPVLDKTLFYQQWHNNKENMSPLLIEAVFAIGGRLADEPAQGQQWLALASKHADSFMDVPRLSTLQALMIILKARESAPKRGYYYRSWMSISQCVQMGKDLGLDEHLSDHAAGRPCGLPLSECLLRSRIWQNIFVCEIMIGTPQGRTDLGVDIDSVDFNVPRPIPGGDETEYHVSRNFTYFARIVRNIGRMTRVYGRIKKTKDWGIDPEFVQLNPSFHSWLNEVPADLTVTYPPDGSAPWLPSPFIGNLHSYYYLSILLLHRPQLNFLQPNAPDGQWKKHMVVCYNSAKILCRLQEAVLQAFGLNGLQCMQRGINFTIYAVLTSIVIHLVALTSPHPELNSDAREYFTRHMRILEKCMGAWPMEDMQKQVDAVREAFSADTRKPFVLKPSFPYGSPQSSSQTSPHPGHGFRPTIPRTGSIDQHLDGMPVAQHSQGTYTGHPISPPISAGPVDVKSDSPSVPSLVMMAAGQNTQAPAMQAMPLADAPAWNPSRIFDQWNTTFGTPIAQSQPTTVASQTRSLSAPSSGAPDIPSLQDIQAAQATIPHGSQPIPTPQYSAAPVQTFVTPAMWQESVASVYEGGLKRTWDYDTGAMPMTKRR